ncbi:hypothetical protein M5K25_002099 [Dendrobium thyrsiflorum]|uniref:C3H1-type domain-containing protein n=1 Tax=Dendrobium thyrsiflorum TaxID=117978 RepID=A0ABD0VTF0_DENTH
MGDPDIDHGFLCDDRGRTDILGSSFFDVHFGNDEASNEYIDRILYQLSLSIEEHIPPGRWYLVSCPPTSSDLAIAPTTTTRGFYLLLVALLILSIGCCYLFLELSGLAFINPSKARNDNLVTFFKLLLLLGAQICAYYVQHGACKYGRTCKFDHPISTVGYNPGSLIDIPAAPYPF